MGAGLSMPEDDAGGATGDARGDIAWLSYAYVEGAALFGVQPDSFRRLAQRKRWRRTLANDQTARIAVPRDAIPDSPCEATPAASPPTSPPAGAPDRLDALAAQLAILVARMEAATAEELVEARAEITRLRDQAREDRARLTQAEREAREARDALAWWLAGGPVRRALRALFHRPAR